MKYNSFIHRKKGGYVTLLSVLTFGAISAAVTIAIIQLGTSVTKTSYSFMQSNQAKALANACMETALQVIDQTTAFSGTAGLTLSTGTCSYTVTDLGLENRQITSVGTAGTAVRHITTTINNINPTIVVSSWQETQN